MKLNWFTLSIAGWRRRPLRTAITAAGVAIAVATLFSLLAFQRGYRAGMQTELDHLGAHVLVVPKGCPYDAASIALHGANWPCYLKAAYLNEVRAVAAVAAAAPVFMAAFFNPDGAQTVYAGVDQDILKLKPGWRVEGRFPRADNELLIGASVAQRQGWRVGDHIPLLGLRDRSGTISGVLEPIHGPDDGFIFLRLNDAQRIFGHAHELTHILVRLRDPDQLDPAVAALRGCDAGMEMNVVPLAHLFRSIQTLVNLTRVWFGCVALVALLAATAGVANAILMAVSERTPEIGVMRALGAARGDIFRLFWFETIHLCGVGGAAGILTAFMASQAVESWLRTRLPFAPAGALLQWDGFIALACFGGALLLGSLAGFLPAWKAARLPPMAAMQTYGGRA